MKRIIRHVPERLVVNRHLIRSTHAYPGGPITGHIVTRKRRLIVHMRVMHDEPRMDTPAKSLRAAVRWAQGKPRMWDELCAVGDRDGIPRNCSRWLRFVGRWPIVGNLRRRDFHFTFHPKTGLAPRPMAA